MRAEIEKAVKDVAYPEVAEALQVFQKEGKPFALPTLRSQDPASTKQRIADLLGGFPFTSDSYPWPTGGPDALHMQPIAQLDLMKASQLLGFNFGAGLLQVWSIVGRSDESLNVLDLALKENYKEGLFLRVIPPEEACLAPTDYFPEFAPWTRQGANELDPRAALLIEPNEAMSRGSTIRWKLSKELMYPKPHENYVGLVVEDPLEKTEDVDKWDLEHEFQAAVNLFLKTPGANGGFYLGGVGGVGDSRTVDPAQGFPLLLNIEAGEMNVSVIFDDSEFLDPEYSTSDSTTHVHFARERLLKAVYCYVG